MRNVIINADDFGLHELVNKAIIEGHSNGIITSTSIMPGGRAFDHAVKLLSGQTIGVGVHLTLVGAMPVNNPTAVPSLVNQEGLLASGYPEFIKKYASGRIDLADVRRELIAQVEKVRNAGIQISHLDSHQHLHVLPGIIDIVLAIARDFRIAALRIPDEYPFFLGGYSPEPVRFISRAGLSFFSRLARIKARQAGLSMPDKFYGMLAGGNLQETFLGNILRDVPGGTAEVMMHPGGDNQMLSKVFGWGYHWEEELAAAVSDNIQSLVKEQGIRLITFRELANE